MKKEEQGIIRWWMHCKGELCCIVWVDKKPILLLSTHAISLSLDLEHLITVPHFSNGKTTDVFTSLDPNTFAIHAKNARC